MSKFSLNYLNLDGSPEGGGPGTVFVDGFLNSIPERVLLVDNVGSNAKVKKHRKNVLVVSEEFLRVCACVRISFTVTRKTLHSHLNMFS